jgi:ribonuclease J
MATGSQGEPSAVLGRLATGRHRFLDVEEGDTIVVSAHTIPGNEETVSRTINRLFQRGANVIYDPIAPVHVSGHASQEEMKLLISLVNPQYFLPIHGELRHLKQHARLAMQLGIPEKRIFVVENGVVIEADKYGVRAGERIPGGYVFVDGSGVGDIGRAVMQEREILARDGFMLVSLDLDRRTGKMIGEPEIISRGFVFLREAGPLLDQVRAAVADVLASANGSSNGKLRTRMEDNISRVLYNETRRRPMVFTIINER